MAARKEIADMIESTDVDQCWLWKGTIDKFGYGRVGGELAHRRVYEELTGPIPEGLVIDHLCRTRACVNPAHMEPVTMRENTLRGIGPSARAARRNHCTHGHEYTPENTRVRNGTRYCRACDRVRTGRYMARRTVAS